jgi:hypothetical protein
MITRRNGPEKEKKQRPKHGVPLSFSQEENLRISDKECEDTIEREQARLWAKLQRAEAQFSTGSIAQRSRALDCIYADLVANSAVGSFTISSEHFPNLTDSVTTHGVLVWTKEQRRLEKAIFFTKFRAAGRWIYAPLQEVGTLVPLGRVFCIDAWMPMFALTRTMTLPLPLVLVMAKARGLVILSI